MSQTTLDVDTFTFTEEDVFQPDICESQHCQEELKKPPHEAEYQSRFTACCGFLYLVCRERVDEFRSQRKIICNCGAIVDGLTIRSDPL